jgi:ankyrin repeat protein
VQGFLENVTQYSYDTDFGDTDILQYWIHMGSLANVQRCLSRANSSELRHHTNFLQQTALHVSISKPKILTLLLSNSFAEVIDAGDRDGTTALMYAAAQGETESVLQLLRHGANITVRNCINMFYTDFIMVRGHFDMFSDIFNFYIAQREHCLAKSTLDIALRSYFYSSSLRLGDWSKTGLRTLLQLGADPNWSTEVENTLLHFVQRAEEAAILLEFGCSPKSTPNVFGHTPLMVLAWIGNISVVRMVIELGAKVDVRDRVGRTALEHALLARETHFNYKPAAIMQDWILRFNIVSELLSAGADPSNSDSCECACSTDGCTIVRCILPQIYSSTGRVRNLVGILWMIEFLLLLKQKAQHTDFTVLIKSLYRRQRFDELGLSHTCCLVQDNDYACRYSSPYESAMEAEKKCEDSTKRAQAISRQTAEELADEEEELRACLDMDCERFDNMQALPCPDNNTTLQEIVVRRAVFIECGMEKAELKASSRSWEHQKQPCGENSVSKYSYNAILAISLILGLVAR